MLVVAVVVTVLVSVSLVVDVGAGEDNCDEDGGVDVEFEVDCFANEAKELVLPLD